MRNKWAYLYTEYHQLGEIRNTWMRESSFGSYRDIARSDM